MRENLQGVPSSIEVDGKTYSVRYYHGFKVELNAQTTVSVQKFSELAERIRVAQTILAEEREIDRQDRALKREQEKKVPVVWARLRNSNEKVQVRGRSAKGRSWESKYLITRANGKKETVSDYALISLSSDEAVLAQIKAEEQALQSEVKVVDQLGDLNATLQILRNVTLNIVFDNDVFTGTFDGLTVQAGSPSDVNDEMVKLVIARERPWSTHHEDGVTRVITTQEFTDRRFANYNNAWANKEDAERYAALQNQLTVLNKRRSLVSEKFDYEAEVAAVKA